MLTYRCRQKSMSRDKTTEQLGSSWKKTFWRNSKNHSRLLTRRTRKWKYKVIQDPEKENPKKYQYHLLPLFNQDVSTRIQERAGIRVQHDRRPPHQLQRWKWQNQATRKTKSKLSAKAFTRRLTTCSPRDSKTPRQKKKKWTSCNPVKWNRAPCDP